MNSWRSGRCAGIALILAIFAVGLAPPDVAAAGAMPPIRFNTAFESGSIGRVEVLGETTFRVWIEGQHDAHGRNHQATWFYFRMEGLAAREITLILAGFPGEYDGRPSRRVKEHYRPVMSEDNRTWRHVEDGTWNRDTIELTLRLQPRGDVLWLAYLQPYPNTRIESLLGEIQQSPVARVETIGTSVRGRPLHLVTITNWDVPDEGKRRLWLIARQHAWETGTSFALEGALRFAVSEDPVARRLRDETILQFVPTMDPDGCAAGGVRFNANGYDLNRNWSYVDLRDPVWLQRLPEVWYVKRAIRDGHARHPIDLVVNLHNTDMNEYLETRVDADAVLERMRGFFHRLARETLFDPSRSELTVGRTADASRATTNTLWSEYGIPVVLLEMRIGPVPELGRRPTGDDRRRFGRELITVMADATAPIVQP